MGAGAGGRGQLGGVRNLRHNCRKGEGKRENKITF